MQSNQTFNNIVFLNSKSLSINQKINLCVRSKTESPPSTKVFIIGAAVLWLEYWRQSRKADEKQQEEDNYFKSLADNVANLNIMVERQDAQLRELNRQAALIGPCWQMLSSDWLLSVLGSS